MNRYDLFERWHPYWDWECFKAGMWSSRRKDVNKIQLCAKVLSSPDECRMAMTGAVNEYPISAQQHLSKPAGRRPWIGQAACCFAVGAIEEETRIAWNFYMTQEAQDSANAIADDVIAEWEAKNA
jgi:hypothetical protein